jgi:23S rRNA A2030 N6-methylase RlmJ
MTEPNDSVKKAAERIEALYLLWFPESLNRHVLASYKKVREVKIAAIIEEECRVWELLEIEDQYNEMRRRE